MDSELKILKGIWDNSEEAPIGLLAKQAGFGIDYTHYICNCLSASEQIKPLKGKRGWYRVTAQGRKELESRGIIKPNVLRKVSEVEKVTYYFPKRLKPRTLKSDAQEVSVKKAKEIRRSNLTAEEKKFNLGRSIVKAVSYLRNI